MFVDDIEKIDLFGFFQLLCDFQVFICVDFIFKIFIGCKVDVDNEIVIYLLMNCFDYFQ